MGDIEDKNVEFLQRVHAIDEAASKALSGIQHIREGGVEGIAGIVAQGRTDELLHGFVNLSIIISLQRDLIKGLTEENLEIMDGIEELARHLEESRDDPSQ